MWPSGEAYTRASGPQLWPPSCEARLHSSIPFDRMSSQATATVAFASEAIACNPSRAEFGTELRVFPSVHDFPSSAEVQTCTAPSLWETAVTETDLSVAAILGPRRLPSASFSS